MSIQSIKVIVWGKTYSYPYFSQSLFLLLFVLYLLIFLLNKLLLKGIPILTQITFFINIISMVFTSWCLLLKQLSHLKTTAVDLTSLKALCYSRPLLPIDFTVRESRIFMSLKLEVTGMFARNTFSNFKVPIWNIRQRFGKTL